jgi:hypothetical protein
LIYIQRSNLKHLELPSADLIMRARSDACAPS